MSQDSDGHEDTSPVATSENPTLAVDRISGILAGEMVKPPAPTPTDRDKGPHDDPPSDELELELDALEDQDDEDSDVGDDEDREDEPAEVLDDDIEVKLDDDEKVTLGELKKRGLRQADYTRKTQALAEERKAFEAERQETQTARQKFIELAKKFDEQLDALEPKEPDWDELKKSVSPEEYAQAYADWDRAQKRRQKLKAERQRVEQEQQQEDMRGFEKYVEEQNAMVLKSVPEFQDQEKGPALMKQLFRYAESQGVRPEEFRQVVSAVAITQWVKAMRYDALLKKKQTLERKRGKGGKSPTTEPGNGRRGRKRESDEEKAAREARENLRKTGSIKLGETAIAGILKQQGRSRAG